MHQPSLPASSRSRSDPRDTRALYGGFLFVGVITVLLGPLIPELQAAWGINHAQTGSLFLMQYAASSVASLFSSLHLRRSLIAGWGLAALGLAGLSTGDWALARPAVTVLGFAMGLLIPSFNLMVARQNPNRRGAALATLNLTWGFGAVSSPLLFAAFAQRFGAFAVVAAIAAVAGAVCVLFAFGIHDAPAAPKATAAQIREDRGSAGTLILIATLFLLYVGAETSVSGWLVALSDEFSTSRSVVSLIIGSGFWGAVLFGRATSAVLLRHFKEHHVFWFSLALASTGTMTLLVADTQGGVAVGALLAGLGLAPLYPLIVAILAEATALRRARIAGAVMSFGGIGGALLPWLSGQVSQAAGNGGSLSRGFVVPVVALLLIAGLYAGYRRARRRGDSQAA